MSASDPVKPAETEGQNPPSSRTRWWIKRLPDEGNDELRYAIRWNRILGLTFVVLVGGYLTLASVLWAYYAVYRKIPDVKWVDIVVLPRFSRVQSAIGAFYYSNAKDLWEKKDYVQAVFTARAAVSKAPRNLDARLFLADCWLKAGRTAEALRALRDGIRYDVGDVRLQKALVSTCLVSGNYRELLKLLREDLPAHGVKLLAGPDEEYKLLEVKAVLETSDVADAARVASAYPDLVELPGAAPVLASIDWDLGRHDEALSLLRASRAKNPDNVATQVAYIDTVLRSGDQEEARNSADKLYSMFPDLLSSQLEFLRAHGSRLGIDAGPWMKVCTRLLLQFRNDPTAYAQLANLASLEGWSDIAYFLYQYSLQERLTGFPFVVYYVGSLVKAGHFAEADAVWHDLVIRNSSDLAATPNMAAMVAWGVGHESEALQIIEQIKKSTADDPKRRKTMEESFRHYGFPKIADELAGNST